MQSKLGSCARGAHEARSGHGDAPSGVWLPGVVVVATGTVLRGDADPSGRPTLIGEMSTPAPEPRPSESMELSVEEVLRHARLHPPYGEMVIDDLDEDEADAFLAAVLS